VLKVDNIRAGYGKIQVLDGVSLDVPAGGLVALLGGNGTGKSTVLKTVAGLLPASAGTVWFDGARIDRLPADRVVRRGLCLVPQGKDVFAQMTVQENLMMGGFVHRSASARLKERLEEAYALFPRLAEFRRRPAGILSGGERQMLSIGRALMAEPKLLMLDEPSAALAPRVVEEITGVVRDLNRRGLTILLVEQNVGLALEVAQHLYIIREGRIALEKAVDPASDLEELKQYYLG
jgi:branched-chain amino acid transport system ATP-binding protein